MAFLNELKFKKPKLKHSKTKIKNADGTVSNKSPYTINNPKIWQCPDIHVPKKQYVAMSDNNKSKQESKSSDNDNDEAPSSILLTHISDTHQKHYRMQSLIPFGDVLIHSGDFVSHCYWPENVNGKNIEKYIIENKITTPKEMKKYIPSEIFDFNEWIGSLPHKYKVVIAGNHECVFNDLSVEFIQKYLLTNCIYLQDSFVKLYGLKIYGTPWTTCSNMGFSFGGDWNFLYSKWENIPNDTDIVVSHLPPLGIFDLAWSSRYKNKDQCKICGDTHEKYGHWGCNRLLNHVQSRIKPKIHLFGHVHDEVGFKMDEKHNILFVNSAMDIHNKAHRIKIVFDL